MKRVWPVLIASGLSLALLLYLGFWQIERLAWKQAMIDRIDQQMAGAPEPFVPGSIQGGEDYQKLSITGRYAAKEPLRLMGTLRGGPGWRLLHAFEVEGGGSVIVERGVAGENASPPPPTETVTITGVTLRHVGGKGTFDGENDPTSNRWYWWDLKAMASSLGLNPATDTRFVLRLLPKEPGSEGLFTEAPKNQLRNNHLGYALTWFGLAAVLVVMTGVFVSRILRTR
jgi:surfeit locus 1 family protein